MADNFEKNWKKALNDIDLSPDPAIWDKISYSLVEGELKYYKKKVAVYKWSAVAAVLIAITFSTPRLFLGINDLEDLRAVSSNPDNSEDEFLEGPVFLSGSKIGRPSGKFKPMMVVDESESQRSSASGNIGNYEMEKFLASENSVIAIPIELDSRSGLPMLNDLVSKVPKLNIYQKADYVSVLARRSDNSPDSKRFWAGVGVGSSSFDPNYQLNQPNDVVSAVMRSEANFVSTSPQPAGQETSFSDRITEGVNYHFGMNMGMMLGNRLSLEGGFNYAEAQLASHTDLIVENKIFAKSVAATSEMVSVQQVSQMTSTQEVIEYERTDITLDNTFQFASIPLIAGYQIIDRKIQVKLNAGFITNFYMGNTLTDPSEQVASLQLFPGANSPYRTVSFSGVTGISVGYNLFNSFDLTIEPNFSQALQSLTREESNFNATPNGFGVLAGLRYRFGH